MLKYFLTIERGQIMQYQSLICLFVFSIKKKKEYDYKTNCIRARPNNSQYLCNDWLNAKGANIYFYQYGKKRN